MRLFRFYLGYAVVSAIAGAAAAIIGTLLIGVIGSGSEMALIMLGLPVFALIGAAIGAVIGLIRASVRQGLGE